VIDLHTHTTASDGRSTPEALVREAQAAGIRTLGVVDHDTTAALPAVEAAAKDAGIAFVPGIEITSVVDGRDVHMLAYYLDPANEGLQRALAAQLDIRRSRVHEMAERLAQIGIVLDVPAMLAKHAQAGGRAVGRPLIGAALVEGGHASDMSDAFDRYLAEGKPAFVPRRGPGPREVVTLAREAGGIVALAHPGRTHLDVLIEPLARHGMQALEVYHPDHTEGDVAHYRKLAKRLGLLATGGSDYHGPNTRRSASFGEIGLPKADFDKLAAAGREARA
jgi:predicted metal-dependent phosphoesterase TrpH